MRADDVRATNTAPANCLWRPMETLSRDGDSVSLWVLPERPANHLRTGDSHFPDDDENFLLNLAGNETKYICNGTHLNHNLLDTVV